MLNIDRLLDLLSALTPRQLSLGLAIASAVLLIVEDRRLSMIPLLIQYILLGLLISSHLYRPIIFTRVGLGFAICLILYITAEHVQNEFTSLRPLIDTENPAWPSSLNTAIRAVNLANMGPIFRLFVVLLGGLVAYGLWRAYPLGQFPSELVLASYWLISVGLMMALTNADPLRVGLGLLTFMNGAEGIYLLLEQSLIVISLLGIVDVVAALAIVICTESWLESFKGEAIR